MQRRHVLKAAAAAALGLPAATLWAAPVAAGSKFILVFLRGA